MATDATDTLAPVQREEEKRVIFASSLGTVFEWYDFYLYAILAPFFAGVFFPPGNVTAALLGAFGAYAAGFLVRPFGALIFGRIGDLVGRKYTFLITITVMGVSTILVGFLPGFKTIGFAAPVLLVVLRLAGLGVQQADVGGSYSTINGIPCDLGERLAFHIHAHVAIYANGQPARQPAAVSLLSMVCRTCSDNCAILAAAAASSATVVRNARSSRE